MKDGTNVGEYREFSRASGLAIDGNDTRRSCLNPGHKAAVQRRSFQREEAQVQSDEKWKRWNGRCDPLLAYWSLVGCGSGSGSALSRCRDSANGGDRRAQTLQLVEIEQTTFIFDAFETDWLVGAAGFEPPHSGIEVRQDSSLGLRDSNLCILKLNLLKFISPQWDVGVDRAPERFVRSAARFEMRKFESWPPG